MVDYKTRIFFEPDNDSVGAEVKIYSEDGENIDNIVITTDSIYQELIQRLDNLDANYVSQEELLEQLTNVTDDIVINATTLDGFSADNFAKLNHNELHQGYFAPVNHATQNNRYGLADTSNYGHVKTVDNLNAQTFVDGEALSAHQGNVLQSNITSLIAAFNPVVKTIDYKGMFKETSGYRFTSDSTIKLAKIGKLVICYAKLRTSHAISRANTEFKVADIPAEFKPRYTVAQNFAHYMHNIHGIVIFDADGIIQMQTNTENSTPVAYVTAMWVTQ